MYVIRATLVAAIIALPALAWGAEITCSQVPDAQRYVEGLRPGPNTSRALQHLDLARSAPSEAQCVSELRIVDRYAKRSAAADRRAAHPRCADVLHQDRPGGSDYRGPPVAGCRRVL
jgi:hypothetical protein